MQVNCHYRRGAAFVSRNVLTDRSETFDVWINGLAGELVCVHNAVEERDAIALVDAIGGAIEVARQIQTRNAIRELEQIAQVARLAFGS